MEYSAEVVESLDLLPLYSPETRSCRGLVRLIDVDGGMYCDSSDWPRFLLEIPLALGGDQINYNLICHPINDCLADNEKNCSYYDLAGSVVRSVSNNQIFEFIPVNDTPIAIWCPTESNKTDWLRAIENVINVANIRSQQLNESASALSGKATGNINKFTPLTSVKDLWIKEAKNLFVRRVTIESAAASSDKIDVSAARTAHTDSNEEDGGYANNERNNSEPSDNGCKKENSQEDGVTPPPPPSTPHPTMKKSLAEQNDPVECGRVNGKEFAIQPGLPRRILFMYLSASFVMTAWVLLVAFLVYRAIQRAMPLGTDLMW